MTKQFAVYKHEVSFLFLDINLFIIKPNQVIVSLNIYSRHVKYILCVRVWAFINTFPPTFLSKAILHFV